MFGSAKHPKAMRQFCEEMRQRAALSLVVMEADNAMQGRRVFWNLLRKPSNFEVDMVSREDQLLSFAPCSIHQENIEVCHRTNDDIALLCVPS